MAHNGGHRQTRERTFVKGNSARPPPIAPSNDLLIVSARFTCDLIDYRLGCNRYD
jgi:hypothetical protein